MAHGVQVGAAAADEMNALHFCATKGHVEPAKLLLAAGGKLGVKCGLVRMKIQPEVWSVVRGQIGQGVWRGLGV